MTKSRIWQSIEKMEQQKAAILDELSQMTEAERTTRPRHMWSAIQAMRHVQISEQMSLGYMKKKLQAGDGLASPTFWPKVKLRLLFMTYFFGMKFKAPAVLPDPPVTSLADLEQDWGQTRESLKALVEDYPPQYLNRAIYKHPFAGMLSLNDAFVFMNAHLAHHVGQVGRIKKALKKLSADDSK